MAVALVKSGGTFVWPYVLSPQGMTIPTLWPLAKAARKNRLLSSRENGNTNWNDPAAFVTTPMVYHCTRVVDVWTASTPPAGPTSVNWTVAFDAIVKPAIWMTGGTTYVTTRVAVPILPAAS